ncbi:MAG: nucleoside deaminase [Bdellovibrionales bacterium]
MGISTDETYMKAALSLAERAWREYDEVPIGCIIVNKSGQIIAETFNQKESLQQATAHAEILAINRACEKLGTWRLQGCRLFVTCEPCAMCAGAIIQSRLDEVIYGCQEPKFGCAQSLYPILSEARHNHRVTLTSGLFEGGVLRFA